MPQLDESCHTVQMNRVILVFLSTVRTRERVLSRPLSFCLSRSLTFAVSNFHSLPSLLFSFLIFFFSGACALPRFIWLSHSHSHSHSHVRSLSHTRALSLFCPRSLPHRHLKEPKCKKMQCTKHLRKQHVMRLICWHSRNG